jgi:hypothetical protein
MIIEERCPSGQHLVQSKKDVDNGVSSAVCEHSVPLFPLPRLQQRVYAFSHWSQIADLVAVCSVRFILMGSGPQTYSSYPWSIPSPALTTKTSKLGKSSPRAERRGY